MVCFNNSNKVMYFLLTIVNVNGLSSVGVFIKKTSTITNHYHFAITNHEALTFRDTLTLQVVGGC